MYGEHELLHHVGGTPLVRLRDLDVPDGVNVYAKLEGQNPAGSVKDRIASAMVSHAESTGQLAPGGTIVEASTGNTAIALAMVARQKGYGLKVVIPEGVVPSIVDILDLYGVEVVRVKPKAGMLGAFETAVELGEKHGWHAVRQFDNPVNVAAHYEGTGSELVAALPKIDAFVAGIGTGGTIMGVGRKLREHHPNVKLIGVEPKLGERLQGLRNLSDGWHPPLLDLEKLDGRFLVRASDAIAMAAHMTRSQGVSAGISSGATAFVAQRIGQRMTAGNIVVMFSDSGWKYLPSRPWKSGEDGDPRLDETHWW